MKIMEYVRSKEVTIDEIEKNFTMSRSYEGLVTGGMEECGECGSCANFYRLRSQAWMSSGYCVSCKSITAGFHADRMSGNFSETIMIFKEKDHA